MPDHLQSRTDDQHTGAASKGGLSKTTILIIAVLVGVVGAILLIS